MNFYLEKREIDEKFLLDLINLCGSLDCEAYESINSEIKETIADQHGTLHFKHNLGHFSLFVNTTDFRPFSGVTFCLDRVYTNTYYDDKEKFDKIVEFIIKFGKRMYFSLNPLCVVGASDLVFDECSPTEKEIRSGKLRYEKYNRSEYFFWINLLPPKFVQNMRDVIEGNKKNFWKFEELEDGGVLIIPSYTSPT